MAAVAQHFDRGIRLDMCLRWCRCVAFVVRKTNLTEVPSSPFLEFAYADGWGSSIGELQKLRT